MIYIYVEMRPHIYIIIMSFSVLFMNHRLSHSLALYTYLVYYRTSTDS